MLERRQPQRRRAGLFRVARAAPVARPGLRGVRVAGAPARVGAARALPLEPRAPAAALADPTAEAPLQLNALGGFLFALLEVPPTKRADIRRVHTHPWLATVEARESALARAEAVACGDAAHLDASGCVLTSAIEISA